MYVLCVATWDTILNSLIASVWLLLSNDITNHN